MNTFEFEWLFCLFNNEWLLIAFCQSWILNFIKLLMTDLDLNIILFDYSSQFVERGYLVMEGVKSLEFLFAWWSSSCWVQWPTFSSNLGCLPANGYSWINRAQNLNFFRMFWSLLIEYTIRSKRNMLYPKIQAWETPKRIRLLKQSRLIPLESSGGLANAYLSPS